jgi:AraC-like DNA-binding protein
MSAFLRAATLTNFEQVARECGLDAQALVKEVGLSPRCLSEPDFRLPASSVGELLELAARRAHEPGFGLRMAASRRLSNLGPLGLMLRDQPTLRHALETSVTYMHTHAEALSVSLVESGDLLSIREELVLDGGTPTPQAIEMGMCSTFRLLQIFLGERWEPRLVAFRHPAPSDTQAHRRVFGSRIAFGQEFNEIVCNARDLAAPNLAADPVMAKYSQQLLERDMGLNAKMSDRVRRLIVLLLPRGHCRVEVVAQHLGVDRRTIANHLAAEGTTYKSLVNSMRTDLLASYLQRGTQNLSEVAVLLGFSELSAFSRWHKSLFNTHASDALKRVVRDASPSA